MARRAATSSFAFLEPSLALHAHAVAPTPTLVGERAAAPPCAMLRTPLQGVGVSRCARQRAAPRLWECTRASRERRALAALSARLLASAAAVRAALLPATTLPRPPNAHTHCSPPLTVLPLAVPLPALPAVRAGLLFSLPSFAYMASSPPVGWACSAVAGRKAVWSGRSALLAGKRPGQRFRRSPAAAAHFEGPGLLTFAPLSRALSLSTRVLSPLPRLCHARALRGLRRGTRRVAGLLVQAAGHMMVGPSCLLSAVAQAPTRLLLCVGLTVLGVGEALAMAPLIASMLCARLSR